jgi:hypothetical protein
MLCYEYWWNPAARAQRGSRGPLAAGQVGHDTEIIGHAVLDTAESLFALIRMHPPPRFVQASDKAVFHQRALLPEP